jgi:hypothetical protein
MQASIRSLLATIAIAGIPAAAAALAVPFLLDDWGEAAVLSDHLARNSSRQKDEARHQPSACAAEHADREGRTRLAQAAGPLPGGPDPFHSSPAGPEPVAPGPFELPHPGMPPFMGGAFPLHGAPRLSCEEAIDRHAAMAGYVKSRLRLNADQKVTWQKIEQAAEPAIDKMRDICAQLPSRMIGPPAVPEAIDFLEKELSARVELLRAVREPIRALYDGLSADQRAALAIPDPRP